MVVFANLMDACPPELRSYMFTAIAVEWHEDDEEGEYLQVGAKLLCERIISIMSTGPKYVPVASSALRWRPSCLEADMQGYATGTQPAELEQIETDGGCEETAKAPVEIGALEEELEEVRCCANRMAECCCGCSSQSTNSNSAVSNSANLNSCLHRGV